MNALLISDTHYTDVPRDAYRWKLFDWLRTAIQEHDVRDLFILGDLCEAKDRHSGRLVNRLVDELVATFKRTNLHKIHILRGNHDSLDPNLAYFRFLRNFPSIEFIETPFTCEYAGREVTMLPHTTDPKKAWDGVEFHTADYILMHATVKGAVSETGMALDGIPAGLLNTARQAKIYSGDVHVPQKVHVGNVDVEYVGSPYPIRFGDHFKPRAVLLENWRKAVSLPINIIQRLSLTVTAADKKIDLGIVNQGDQIKVRIKLSPSEYGDWNECKRRVLDACVAAGVEVCGLELERVENKIKLKTPTHTSTRTPQQTLTEFCIKNKVGREVGTIGTDLLTQTLGD